MECSGVDKISWKNMFNWRINKCFRNNIIKIKAPRVDKNVIKYTLDVSEDLNKFFIQKESFIEYMDIKENFDEVPDGILIIPFLCNILPVSWMCDSKIVINELDKTFYYSIQKIKEVYSKMYPNVEFKGKLIVKNIIDYEIEQNDKYLSFFSLGVDSTSTVLSNIEKNPLLTTIWGSDIPLEEKNGWNFLQNKITEFSNEFELEKLFIKSDFRKLLNAGKLTNKFGKQLNDNWWHGLQHGMSIISHAVPIAYLFQISNILIASSSSRECEYFGLGEAPCASSLSVDIEFKFCENGKVYHDGFENFRQDKLKIITNFCDEHTKKLFLHVCWETTGGINCNICEKCSRTIMGIIAINHDPNKYGFSINEDVFDNIKENINEFRNDMINVLFWLDIQNTFLENCDYWANDKNISWFLNLDLELKDMK